MKSFITRGCIAIPILLFGSTLAAQTTLNQNLDETLVVANRHAQINSNIGASTEVITREEILASQATDLSELLAGHAGISIARNGGAGQNASLFMRGTDSDHTLIIVGGQPVNSLADGRARLEFLALNQIESIEIVRGARSSLYGSDAVGGVISITTASPNSQALGGAIQISGGSHEFAGLQGNLFASNGTTDMSIGLQHQAAAGTDSRVGFNPDRDGYEKTDLSISLGHQLSASSRLLLSHSDNDSFVEFDDGSWAGAADGEDDFSRQQTTLGAQWQISEQLDSQFSLSRSGELYTSNGLFGPFVSNSDRRKAAAQLSFTADNRATITLASEFQQDRYQSNFLPTGLDRDNFALTAVVDAGIEGYPLTLSLRQDMNEQYGDHLTGHLSLRWSGRFGLLWVSYGSAFKAPNFFDLYGFGGDANLKPENSRTMELGWKVQTQQLQISSALFNIRTDNLIEFDNGAFQIFNVGNARINGGEFSVSGQMGEYDLGLQLTLLDHENLDTGADLPRRPDQTARIDLSRSFGRTDFGLSLTQQSDSRDIGNVTLESFATAAATLAHHWNDRWTLLLRADNLTNEQYQTVNGYNQPGRTFRLSMRYAL